VDASSLSGGCSLGAIAMPLMIGGIFAWGAKKFHDWQDRPKPGDKQVGQFLNSDKQSKEKLAQSEENKSYIPALLRLLKSTVWVDQCNAIHGLEKINAVEALPKLLPLLRDPKTDPSVLTTALQWMSNLKKERETLAPLSTADREELAAALDTFSHSSRANPYQQSLAEMAILIISPNSKDEHAVQDPLFSELELASDVSAYRRNPNRLYREDVEVIETHPDGSPRSVVLKTARLAGRDILPAGTFLYFTEEGKLGALRPAQKIRLRGMDFHYADSIFLDDAGRIATVVLEEDGDLLGVPCARAFPVSIDDSGNLTKFKLAKGTKWKGNRYPQGAVVTHSEGKVEWESPRTEPLLKIALTTLGAFGLASYALQETNHSMLGKFGAGLIFLIGGVKVLDELSSMSRASAGLPKLKKPSRLRIKTDRTRIATQNNTAAPKNEATVKEKEVEEEDEEQEDTSKRRRSASRN